MAYKESKFEILFTAKETTGSEQLQKTWAQKYETDLIDAVNEVSSWYLLTVEEQIPVAIPMPERATNFAGR